MPAKRKCILCAKVPFGSCGITVVGDGMFCIGRAGFEKKLI